ncbi:MAG: TerB family tellurite resistance protein [Bacteroidota bacterium]
MPEPLTDDALADLTLLALVIAHGADADLDPREVNTLAEHLHRLAPHLSPEAVTEIVKDGARAYLDTRVEGAETVVYRLAGALSADGRAEAYAALQAVAEADETLHPMESTLLRHVAAAWRVDV